MDSKTYSATLVSTLVAMVVKDDNANRALRTLTFPYVFHSNNCIWAIPSRLNMSVKHYV